MIIDYWHEKKDHLSVIPCPNIVPLTRKGQVNSNMEKNEKKSKVVTRKLIPPIEENKVNFNFDAEERLDHIIEEVDALANMIDALFGEIQRDSIPAYGTCENIRIFLQNRFHEVCEGLSEISDTNRIVSYDDIICDE